MIMNSTAPFSTMSGVLGHKFSLDKASEKAVLKGLFLLPSRRIRCHSDVIARLHTTPRMGVVAPSPPLVDSVLPRTHLYHVFLAIQLTVLEEYAAADHGPFCLLFVRCQSCLQYRSARENRHCLGGRRVCHWNPWECLLSVFPRHRFYHNGHRCAFLGPSELTQMGPPGSLTFTQFHSLASLSKEGSCKHTTRRRSSTPVGSLLLSEWSQLLRGSALGYSSVNSLVCGATTFAPSIEQTLTYQ